MKTKTITLFIIVLLASIMPVDAQIQNDSNQDKNRLKYILERFCVEHYDDCFFDRIYIEGSLVINDIEKVGEIYKIKGTHSYIGSKLGVGFRKLLPYTYNGVNYKAEVSIISEKKFKVVFRKWFVLTLIGDGKWEECEKTFLE